MWKLVPPRDGKTVNWYIRGKYLGIALDHSTGTTDRRAAATILATWKRQAERGEFHRSTEPAKATFLSAAVAYMQAGGERSFIEPILKSWGARPLETIDQVAIDTLANQLYPDAEASTRNRQVYTPVSAIFNTSELIGRSSAQRAPMGISGRFGSSPTRRLRCSAPRPRSILNSAFSARCSTTRACA